MIRCLFVVVFLFGGMGLASCSSTSNGGEYEGEDIQTEGVEVIQAARLDKPESFSIPIEGTPKLFVNYKLSPGDMLDVLFQIQTWKGQNDFSILVDHEVTVKFANLPELTETQRVRPNGMISLPHLGEVKVVGMSVSELTKELQKLYAPILRDPELYVTVADFRQRIEELKKDLHTAPRGLSRLVQVRPDGYATFPMVGDTFVAGRSVPEVKHELDTKYEHVMPGMHVDLFLEKHTGSRIYVYGEVAKPDAYLIQKPITVFEALAMAGNFTYKANTDNIMVMRREEKEIIVTKIDMNKSWNLDEELYYLQPDDLIYVPKSGISTAAEVMQQLADIILFRGWGISGTYQLNQRSNSTTSRINTPTINTVTNPTNIRTGGKGQ